MTSRNLRILVIDDNETDVDILMTAFAESSIPHQFTNFFDGHECLKLLQKTAMDAPKNLPHLILLDMNIPGVDSLELLKILKNDNFLKSIPIIVMSGSENSNQIKQCYDAHASFYIIKPSDVNQLIRFAQNILELFSEHIQHPN